MTDPYANIRKALEMGPTPGPWAVNPALAQVDAMPSTLPVCKLLWPTTKRTEAETWANGQIIAACDPDTIRALLEERDRLAAALEAAQMGLRYAVRVWVLSDEIVWSEKKIDEVVESIIDAARAAAKEQE